MLARTPELLTLLSLAFAGALGGALNSVAGGGSLVVFPTLVLAGVSPVSANATTTLGLWPASGASAYAYRRELPEDRRLVLALALASLVGGLAGALLLLRTSDDTFERLIPVLIGLAAALFTFGPALQRRLGPVEAAASAGTPSRASWPSARRIAVGALVQVGIATYGGYFGGGMGILMLATFSLIGLSDMHAMNGLKNVLGAVLNGIAIVAFVWAGQIEVIPAIAVAVGGIAGGYGGASVARKIPAHRVRVGVIVFAWSMAVYFAWRAFG